MAWPYYKPTLTVIDVLESGACLDSIKAWILKHGGTISGSTVDYPDTPEIAKAANADGDGGDGYGYGDGGDGYGYGDGGDGYGDGDGDEATF